MKNRLKIKPKNKMKKEILQDNRIHVKAWVLDLTSAAV